MNFRIASKETSPSARDAQEGMSLVEIIISIFLIMILFSLLIMEVATLSISKGQKYENIAYHVANKQMEDLRQTALSEIPSSGTISSSLLAEIPSGSGTFWVDDYPGHSGVKEVVVTVTWSYNGQKSVVLTTLMGSGGFNLP